MQRNEEPLFTRERPFEAKRTCLLLIDTQNYVWNPEVAKRQPYFDRQVREVVLPNLRKLIDAFHRVGAEVMYTVIENYTRDGRDRSLDYKLSKFFIAKGSWEAKVLDAIAPGNDDIILPKTSSSVFNSTNIEYLLRNIGIDTLVVTGFLTDQCVDHTARDAADRGFYPVCLPDACATHSEARHENALKAFAGYCRTMTTAQLLAAVDAAAR
ncbi:MAG TPA: isochorismatase family cysteine hydrolase [Dongiaceae bacterium]|jgi:nicotinamidase-related amidase|nr:isochorismatase family cysteine hydrolase [Dongiaceae bacterium]